MTKHSVTEGGKMEDRKKDKKTKKPAAKFWVSWWAKDMAFEIHSPWWISGSRGDEDDGSFAESVVAAVQADSEDAAKRYITNCHDDKSIAPDEMEWRFVIEQPKEWSPFSNRFPRADWMVW